MGGAGLPVHRMSLPMGDGEHFEVDAPEQVSKQGHNSAAAKSQSPTLMAP
jgi:hypothetical protein